MDSSNDANSTLNSNTTTHPQKDGEKQLCNNESNDSDDKTPLTVNLNIESIIDYEYASHQREEKNNSSKCIESKLIPTLLCTGDDCLTFHTNSVSNTTFP